MGRQRSPQIALPGRRSGSVLLLGAALLLAISSAQCACAELSGLARDRPTANSAARFAGLPARGPPVDVRDVGKVPAGRAAAAPLRTRGGQDSSGIQGGGTATIPNEIFNLVKSIVGAGVLSLPAGIAAFGDAPGAILPAVSLIAGIGLVSGYMFSLIGRVCASTGSSTFSEAWSKTVGEKTSWVPAVSYAQLFDGQPRVQHDPCRHI